MDNESPTVIAQHVQASRYFDMVGLVVLLYNHVLTFDDEVRFIWKAPTTLPKVLFLLQRYVVPLVVILSMNNLTGLARIVFSDNYCKVTIGISIFIGMATIAISNILVLLRLWVLWERSRRLMYWTSAAFLLSQVAAFTVASFVVSVSLRYMIYDADLSACVIAQKVGVWDGILWLPGLLFECVIFILIWWNVLQRPTHAGQISGAIFRDGLTYFVVLFALRLTNMLMGALAPVSLLNLGVMFVWCTTTVTTSNLIINVRKSSAMRIGDDLETEPDFELPPLPNSPRTASQETVVRKSSRKSSMGKIWEKSES